MIARRLGRQRLDPEAAADLVCEAASVLSAARPSAPPTSREVLIMPEARPLSAALTP